MSVRVCQVGIVMMKICERRRARAPMWVWAPLAGSRTSPSGLPSTLVFGYAIVVL